MSRREENMKLLKSMFSSTRKILSVVVATLIILSGFFIISVDRSAGENAAFQTPARCNLGVCKKKFQVPPLLIISYDGFRNSYLEQNITPAIQRLINCGTHSKYMLPVFPAKTFPNHYSIATGLYPAWHGIVDNRFYDTNFSAFFKKSTKEPGWYLGEPIWKTAQKAGLKSAVFFWPGSEAAGNLPNYWMKYDSSVAFTYRVDTIINWLKLPDDERPSLIHAYFEEPDAAGHKFGPHSQEVRTTMITMDGIINYLVRRLLEEDLMSCVNLILISDHGMQQMEKANFIAATNYTKVRPNDLFFSGTMARFQVNRSNSPSENGNTSFQATLQVRISVTKTWKDKEAYNRLGDHGYDNRIVSMRTIFIAVGPDIAENKEIDAFQNVELYNLFAYLLRIDAINVAPNNGTNGTLFAALRKPPPFPITNVAHSSDHCTDQINMKMCSCSHNCTLTNSTHQNCSMTLGSSVRASNDFTGTLCTLQFCDAIIHFDKELRKTVMVEGILRSDSWTESARTQANCITYIDKVTHDNSCKISHNENYSLISLFGNVDNYYMLDLARVLVPKDFVDEIWQHILNKAVEYMDKYANVWFFSGAIYDQEGDGVRDSNESIQMNYASHLFYIFMWCINPINRHTLCRDVSFVPYILPVNDKNLNCSEPEAYLYDHTARIRDIELLTGMEFFTDRNIWSDEEAIALRTLLTTEEQ
ncbi:unnamed protein product [Litomosoides sigmodontis]|uniref:Extracellular Endonuclease subunit A domain-containing protein n=1 Tax=Litomosoides sigmodontis TaxID=42156 RepID=A0A3P6T2X9_LITSI|nr:unnamed protein product [Litomosoides sigmodontis]